MSDPVRIIAPWTEDHIRSLAAFQRTHCFEPVTCPGAHAEEVRMTPTADGWICPDLCCGARQFWADAWMTNGDWARAIMARGVEE